MKVFEVLSQLPALPIGPDYVSSVKAGLTMHAKPVYVPNVTKKMLKEQPVVTVPISAIQTGQPYLIRSRVKHYVEQPSNAPLTLVDQDGQLVVIDGNHRLMAAILRGDSTVQAQIFQPRQPKPRR